LSITIRLIFISSCVASFNSFPDFIKTGTQRPSQ